MLYGLYLPLAFPDLDNLRQAADLVNALPADDRTVVQTWLVFEGLGRMLYYLLVFLAVFLLGRRIIQATIAGYREARSESV